jgi:hypothetical protein
MQFLLRQELWEAIEISNDSQDELDLADSGCQKHAMVPNDSKLEFQQQRFC